jgi:hypothetical protein
LRRAPALAENEEARPRHEVRVSYLIAAYAVVIGTLLGYGLRVQAQRRARLRAAPSQAPRRKS